jgi:hypothetical protein
MEGALGAECKVKAGPSLRQGMALAVAHPLHWNQMPDRIVCSCVTCPRCGTWVVVEREMTREANKEKLNAVCPAPECGKQFAFAGGETKVFELPLNLFERRHFFRSDLS